MGTKLLQFEKRIEELELMASQVDKLAYTLATKGDGQPELSEKGHAWFRGARELLAQQKASSLGELDACYIRFEEPSMLNPVPRGQRAHMDIERYLSLGLSATEQPPNEGDYHDFYKLLTKARSLIRATVEEIRSRELPVVSQLSFAVSSSEFATADELLSQSTANEPLVRASGVVARVAIERHLLTVADAHSVPVTPSSHGKKVIAQDVLNALAKQNVINAIQKSELEGLFKIGNFCAHPKEAVAHTDVSRLVNRGRELCAVIL